MTKNNTSVAEEPVVSHRRKTALLFGLPLWVLAGFILSQLAVATVVELLQVTGFSFESVNGSTLNAVVAAVVYTLTIVIVIGVPLLWRKIRTTREELGLSRLPDWFDIFLAPASFVVYMLLAGALLAAVTGLFPGFDAEEVQDVGFEDLSHSYEYALAFITLVIIAPVAEEVLLRGYLYGKLRKVSSLVTAMLISSLLFSVMHFQWNVALNVLPLGIVLVVLREMTGSIWAGILLHMLKNGVAFYLLFVNPTLMNTIGG